MSLAWNGGKVVSISIVPFYYFGIAVVKEFFTVLCQHYPFRVRLCRGLVMRGWNHGVGSEVGVAPVIGQYLGLGCFSIVG